MKPFLPLISVFTLAACAGAGSAWVKDGASEDQVRADQAARRTQVEGRLIGRSESYTRDIRSSTRGGREDTRSIVSESRDRSASLCIRYGLGSMHGGVRRRPSEALSSQQRRRYTGNEMI
jgi:hypothetical protein